MRNVPYSAGLILAAGLFSPNDLVGSPLARFLERKPAYSWAIYLQSALPEQIRPSRPELRSKLPKIRLHRNK
jgi:hypothetical protein